MKRRKGEKPPGPAHAVIPETPHYFVLTPDDLAAVMPCWRCHLARENPIHLRPGDPEAHARATAAGLP